MSPSDTPNWKGVEAEIFLEDVEVSDYLIVDGRVTVAGDEHGNWSIVAVAMRLTDTTYHTLNRASLLDRLVYNALEHEITDELAEYALSTAADEQEDPTDD